MIACFDSCAELTLETLERARSPLDAPEETDPAFLRSRMEEELNAASAAAGTRYDKPAAYRARRMVTAWADERLSVDPWPGREQWIARPLQSDWEEGRTAGEWFFTMLDNLDPARPHHAALAALALRLMALGFDGRMYRSPEELVAFRQKFAARFGIAHPVAPFPPAIGEPAPPRPRRLRLLPWILPLLAAAAAIWGVRRANARLERLPVPGPASVAVPAAPTAPPATTGAGQANRPAAGPEAAP